MENDINVNVAQSSALHTYAEGYERDYQSVLPEAVALGEDDLLSGPTDVETTSLAVFNKAPALAELDADAVTLPKFDLHAYQQLGARTRALCHAESEYKMAETPPKPIDEKVEKLMRVKPYLLAQVDVLVITGRIGGVPVEALKFNTGTRQVAANTRHVCVYLRNHWEQISGHTTMTLAELAEYTRLSEEVYTELAQRELRPARLAETARVRRQMFSLVLRSVNEVKRAAEYFHGEKADRFIPAVYANLGKRAKRAAEPEDSVPAEPTVAVPAVSPPAAPAADAPVIPPGMPGASPYMR